MSHKLPISIVRGAAKEATSLVQGFKEFALRGNVIDLAVGVIIGAAFGKIVDSLVANVVMPLLNYVTPKVSFTRWQLGNVKVGLFLNDVLSFLITAAAIYLFIVKFIGWLRSLRRDEAAQPALAKQEQLLTEIRDLLRAGQGPAE